jgi:hypothetical protein
MQKGSTAAAKQSRNFSQQRLTIGWTWPIARAGIAGWTKRVRLS